MTNGDRVRNMKDEDLAFVLMCPYEVEEGMCNQNHQKNCYSCALDWLKQEEEQIKVEYDMEKHMGEVLK